MLLLGQVSIPVASWSFSQVLRVQPGLLCKEPHGSQGLAFLRQGQESWWEPVCFLLHSVIPNCRVTGLAYTGKDAPAESGHVVAVKALSWKCLHDFYKHFLNVFKVCSISSAISHFCIEPVNLHGCKLASWLPPQRTNMRRKTRFWEPIRLRALDPPCFSSLSTLYTVIRLHRQKEPEM